MGSLKIRAAALQRKNVKDFDPEDDTAVVPADSDDSASEDDHSHDGGREHYEAVDKSKLRIPEEPTLGAKYFGVAVSRKALEDEEHNDPFAPVDDDDEEDPFAAREEDDVESEEDLEQEDEHELDAEVDEDDEIDSDKALGESDVERFKHLKFRGSKKNQIQAPGLEDEDEELSDAGSEELELDDLRGSTDASEIEIEMAEDNDDEGSGDEDDASSISSASSASSVSSPPANGKRLARNSDREELRRTQSASTAGLALALSAGINADVAKGRAVKQQRQTFDHLLDARIKLQKGISAMNELPRDTIDDEEVKTAARQAEEAALALWSTIDSIRCTIASTQERFSSSSSSSSKLRPPKRKQPPLNPSNSTSLSDIWAHTTTLDAQIDPSRRRILDKWYAETQPVTIAAADAIQKRSKLHKQSTTANTSNASRITDVLDTYLLSTSTSTSAHPHSGSPTEIHYDDTPFYQSLLRDLVSSRTNISTSSLPTGSSTTTATKLHTSGSSAKNIDTKASKGRKIRYTVHEKLENFMASEDRNTWTEAARREFFGSLLGRGDILGEQRDDWVDSDEDGDGEGDREGEALRLFRN